MDKKKIEPNIIGSGFSIKAFPDNVNLLIKKEDFDKIKEDDKGIVRLVLCKKRTIKEGGPEYYIRENKKFLKED